MSNNPYRCEALDQILAILRPYKPKKFILGEYYMWAANHSFVLYSEKDEDGIMQTGMKVEARYRGIPIERSERKYELDLEL